MIKKGERVIGIELTKAAKTEVTEEQVLQEMTEISSKTIRDLENVAKKKIIGRNLVEIEMRKLKIRKRNIKIEIRVKIEKK